MFQHITFQRKSSLESVSLFEKQERPENRFLLVTVIMHLMFMTGMSMVMWAMVPSVVVGMIKRLTGMVMGMLVFMRMFVHMYMAMKMRVFGVPMGMFMDVFMSVLMGMNMGVFVVTVHDLSPLFIGVPQEDLWSFSLD